MQYGVDIFPYRRANNKNSTKKTERMFDYNIILKYVKYFLICFFISRVKFINNFAPFGIVFFISIIMYVDNITSFVAALATFLGSFTVQHSVESIVMNAIIIGVVLSINYFYCKEAKKTKLIVISIIIFMNFLINNIFIRDLSVEISILNSMLEFACILPMYYIMNFGILSFRRLNKKDSYTNEEIISMGIIVGLLAAGTWGITVYTISIMNIFGLLIAVIMGYIYGSGVGTATGVALGLIMGISNQNMLVFVSMFGLSGLVSGIFKKTGKWLSAAAYMVTFLIIQIYIKDVSQFKIIEGIISCIIFLVVSNKAYNILYLDLNNYGTKSSVSEGYMDVVKNVFTERLDAFSKTLINLSDALINLSDNDKLILKSKSSELVENLADRVCSDCDMNSICWRRELYFTYSYFFEMIENFQNDKNEIPKELCKKCIKNDELIKNTKELVNNYIINEIKRKSLSEGRELLANQIGNIANYAKEISKNIDNEIVLDSILRRNLKKALYKNNINYYDVICFENSRGILTIKLMLKEFKDKENCIETILSVINAESNKQMIIENDEINFDINTNLYSLVFKQRPKYSIMAYGVGKCKEGEKYSGDSYDYYKLKDGDFIAAISDGMGSGPQAGRESKAVLKLIKSYTNAGLSKFTAINAVNSMMAMKFSEEEKFSTVDLCSIDLYTGNAEFMKVGAVASFIKSGEEVEVIKSKTLPMGILDKVDIDVNDRRVKDGDLIIMLSDGALDYNDDNIGKNEWIIEYLKGKKCDEPKQIAQGLLSEAIKLSDYKTRDDITIVVLKVDKVY
ncbi:stage II sporulation protein E [Clostridium tepidiprofundi DSM 19306]|uniref:Stage II sporulation protein E n=1 Tax=Clostridium tepidiprofundi DSM 19306 TaxID=1121338 RepID=A0A151B389_9CLOT|nr:stage II sporulation protein E [Clostridium tepidiprofundi]KYH34375.1 stage II sporulation protein E [Clostridium tepidiprofundi DSM 19306]